MLIITEHLRIPISEIHFSAIRAQGAGGQNVNKVSSAVHLRFDISASSLPDQVKDRLRQYSDQRITSDGIVIIKAQAFRSQEKNREHALERLKQLLIQVTTVQKKRRPTRPSRSSQKKRLDRKAKHSRTKSLRRRVSE